LGNIKDFLVKFKDFLRENSTLEKTSFPKELEFKESIANKIIALAQNDSNFIFRRLSLICLFFEE